MKNANDHEGCFASMVFVLNFALFPVPAIALVLLMCSGAVAAGSGTDVSLAALEPANAIVVLAVVVLAYRTRGTMLPCSTVSNWMFDLDCVQGDVSRLLRRRNIAKAPRRLLHWRDLSGQSVVRGFAHPFQKGDPRVGG